MAKYALISIVLLIVSGCSGARHAEQKVSQNDAPLCGLEALELSGVMNASGDDVPVRFDVEIKQGEVVVSQPTIVTASGKPFSVEFQTDGRRRKDPPVCFRVDLVHQLVGEEVHLGGGAQISSKDGPATFSVDEKIAPGASFLEQFELGEKSYTISIKPAVNKAK